MALNLSSFLPASQARKVASAMPAPSVLGRPGTFQRPGSFQGPGGMGRAPSPSKIDMPTALKPITIPGQPPAMPGAMPTPQAPGAAAPSAQASAVPMKNAALIHFLIKTAGYGIQPIPGTNARELRLSPQQRMDFMQPRAAPLPQHMMPQMGQTPQFQQAFQQRMSNPMTAQMPSMGGAGQRVRLRSRGGMPGAPKFAPGSRTPLKTRPSRMGKWMGKNPMMMLAGMAGSNLLSGFMGNRAGQSSGMQQGYGQALNEFQQNVNPSYAGDSYLPRLWSALTNQPLFKQGSMPSAGIDPANLNAILGGVGRAGAGAAVGGLIGGMEDDPKKRLRKIIMGALAGGAGATLLPKLLSSQSSETVITDGPSKNLLKEGSLKKKDSELIKLAFLPALARGAFAAGRGLLSKAPGGVGNMLSGVGSWMSKWKGAPGIAGAGQKMEQWGANQAQQWGNRSAQHFNTAKQHYAQLPNWAQQTYRGGRGALKKGWGAYQSIPGQIAEASILYPMTAQRGAQEGAGQALSQVANTYENLDPMSRFGLAFDPSQLRRQMAMRVPQELAGYLN